MSAQRNLEKVLLEVRLFARDVGDQVRNKQQKVRNAIRRSLQQQHQQGQLRQEQEREPLVEQAEQEVICEEKHKLLEEQLEIEASTRTRSYANDAPPTTMRAAKAAAAEEN